MPVTGTVSNLGFGSGILTQDHIDKLKKAEEAARLSKYKELIEENGTKQKDLTEIKTKLLSFQTAVSSLGDATAFAARKVIASIKDNPPAELSANAGVALQSMKVNVTQLAEKDVYQSKALSNETGYVNASLTKPEKITFFQNGKEYTVTVDKNTTYKDLAEEITTASEGNIVAKVINTGEKPNGYRLTLTSKETGENNAISFYPGSKEEIQGQKPPKWKYKESNEAKEIFKNLGWELDDKTKPTDVDKDKKGYGVKDQTNHLKKAQNAEFTMDGVKMIRPSNTITDLAVGLTLTLNKTGEVNFDVQQDTEAISKAMEDLVTAYNDLVTNLNAATDYNKDTGTKGTLQGVTEVNSIRSNIIATLFDSQPIEGKVKDENGNDINSTVMLSMQDFGITMTESGTLNFSKSTFDKKMKENPEFAESFFSGVTKYKDIDHKGELIENNKPDKDKDIEFKPGDFKIVFNNEVYDLGKNKDGTNFKLTGKDAAERMNNLVAHINSLGIDGLTVKAEAIDESGKKGFKLSFHSENGSDFGIEGGEKFLKQFGLSKTNITAQPIEGKGIFSKLKTVLQNMTGDKGSLTKYDEGLTKDTKQLKEAQESTQKFIDARYETMQAQFLKYEGILTKLNLQQQTVTGMINSMNQNN